MDWEMSQANDQLRTVSIRESKELIFSFFESKSDIEAIHRNVHFCSPIREKIQKKSNGPLKKLTVDLIKSYKRINDHYYARKRRLREEQKVGTLIYFVNIFKLSDHCNFLYHAARYGPCCPYR